MRRQSASTLHSHPDLDSGWCLTFECLEPVRGFRSRIGRN